MMEVKDQSQVSVGDRCRITEKANEFWVGEGIVGAVSSQGIHITMATGPEKGNSGFFYFISGGIELDDPVLCPKCETGVLSEGDYLCEQCRYG
jgi:hypothetical protein